MKTRTTLMSAAAVTAALALTLSACGSGSSGSTGAEGGKGGAVIVGTTDPITALDPANSYDVGSQTVIQNIFQTLLTMPAGQQKPVPEAAKSCAWKGTTTYTCTMQSGLKFSNGDPLTAQDVKFSFDRLLGIKSPTGPSSLFTSVKSVAAPNASTVTFTLGQADALFPDRLAHSGASIVDRKVFPKDKPLGNDKVIGSGPYAIEKYTAGQQVALKANPNYKGTVKLQNKQAVVEYFSQASAMKQAIEKGSINVAYRTFSPTDVKSLRGEAAKGVKVVEGTGSEKRYLVFNTKAAPGQQKAVRQAVASSIDRSAIAKNVYDDTVTPLYSMVGNGDPGQVEAYRTLYGAAPDKAKAAKFLKDAGVKTPVSITLNYTPTHYGPASADEYTEIQRQLQATGLFKVKLASTEWQQYLNSALKDHSFPAFQIGWVRDFPDPDNDLTTFFGKNAVVYTGYTSKPAEQAISAEEAQTDQSKRIPDLQKIQQIAAQDTPVIPLWQGKLIAVTRTGVSGTDQALDPMYFRLYELSAK
ncbi:ABC transporter substrate-binding protein [Mangrovactinospora gilvigrisea]|uniref:ABC transporter substrate-binding protein n=1 Tax=Mangrovactinospora gilvigrisea TaxID=1428644 RepID=A0A1J7CFE5_9ACTN|nr:ABC transporter substrate-binding protein [Mangrovactinospora gilvigrisea]OIV38418.1 ABC transporter substrate-binding protein [Mangrovactinospora gilvigrisea]